MSEVPFVKMHGLGNDVVVIDGRTVPVALDAARVRAMADRRRGIGFDQLMLIRASDVADAGIAVMNADGGTVEACGNGTRCVAALLMDELKVGHLSLESDAGILSARAAGDGLVSVDMGPARLAWDEIPLARAMDTLHMDLSVETAAGTLSDPVGVSMGNPHAVFFVSDPDAFDLAALGPRLENDPLFPERANISLAAVEGATIRLRVWERGAGLTQACGSAACASLVAANRRGLTGRSATVVLPGGALGIEWRDDGHVVMTGPVAQSFRGTVDPDSLVDGAP